MKILFLACLIVSPFANAETHGGVRRANAEFAGVSRWAGEEGGTLYRVMGVRRGAPCGQGTRFEVDFGGMDASGKEHIEYTDAVVATYDDFGFETIVVPASEAQCN